jgi:hypothetical protein
MPFVESKPDHLPDIQFAEVIEEQLDFGFTLSGQTYEFNSITYAHTTDGQSVAMPRIRYESFTEYTRPAEVPTTFLAHMRHVVQERREIRRARQRGIDFPMKSYMSQVESIAEIQLTHPQREAITTAAELQRTRKNQTSELAAFASLRKVNVAANGLLYICTAEIGNGLDKNTPYAAVKSVSHVGDIDFATATQRYYGLFQYNQPDIGAFVPDPLRAAKPNAYSFLDQQYVHMTHGRGYQIARLRLFNVEADLEYPLRLHIA